MSISYNTGIASEYLVLSNLYRLGLDAYMSLGNKKSVDIAICKNGRTITLDVKAVKGYSSIIVNNMKSSEDHYVVIVIYNDKFDNLHYIPDMFIAKSTDIYQLIKSYKDQKRIMKTDIIKYKDNWSILQDF